LTRIIESAPQLAFLSQDAASNSIKICGRWSTTTTAATTTGRRARGRSNSSAVANFKQNSASQVSTVKLFGLVTVFTTIHFLFN
jgi:hypothetical protein